MTYAEVEKAGHRLAADWLVSMQAGDFMGSGSAPWFAGPQGLRQTIKQYALAHPFNLDEIMDAALAGWQEAHTALCELIAEFEARGEAKPAGLATYNIKLARAACTSHGIAGKQKASNFMQDLVVAALIMELLALGLREYRNQLGRKRRASACSIAAEALAAAGLHRGGEEAVRKIWKRYRAALVPGWHRAPPQLLAKYQ